jgi:Icc-related predicted phosphoesterase
MSKKTAFTFACIGDIHAREDKPGSVREMFEHVSEKARALVLCGDLTDNGTPRQAELLADEMRSCTLPIIGVLGNHDYESGHSEVVKETLNQAGVRILDGQCCEIEGVSFAGVKGFGGGFGRRMLGSFGEPAIKTFVAEAVNEAMKLENALREAKNKLSVVVLHYTPIAETAEGEPPELYPFLGCSRLAETIDRYSVAAVLHGHAHRGKYQGRTPGGAPVYNVALSVTKPSGQPYALISIGGS